MLMKKSQEIEPTGIVSYVKNFQPTQTAADISKFMQNIR